MSGNVQFNDEWQPPTMAYKDQKNVQQGEIINLVIKTGIVKNTQQANFALLAIAILSIIVTIMIITSGAKGEPKATFRKGDTDGIINY